MGLDENNAGPVLASGPAAYLDDKLGHTLSGAEVGAQKTCVRVDDPYQCQPGEVVTLGKHLGAYQYVSITTRDLPDHLLH